MNIPRPWLRIALLLAALRMAAQTPPPSPTTAVLVNLSVKSGIDRAQVNKVLPEEVRQTVKVYLDGKIQQWYSKSDGKGVMFLMNCATVAEAKAIMEALPLSKANLVDLEYTPLAPLQPLRFLVAEPSAK